MPEVELTQDPPIDPKVEEAVKNEQPIPGLAKFWNEETKSYNQEDIQKSYLALQRKFSEEKNEEKADLTIEQDKPEDPKPDEAPTDPEVNPDKVVEDAGLNMDELRAEYAEKVFTWDLEHLCPT